MQTAEELLGLDKPRTQIQPVDSTNISAEQLLGIKKEPDLVDFISKPLIPFSRLVPEEKDMGVVKGALRGFLKVAEGLTSPLSIGLIAGTAGLGAYPTLG